MATNAEYIMGDYTENNEIYRLNENMMAIVYEHSGSYFQVITGIFRYLGYVASVLAIGD